MRADVNGDGRVTSIDALRIINWLSAQKRDESDTDALQFAAQVDEVFGDDDDLIEESAGTLF